MSYTDRDTSSNPFRRLRDQVIRFLSFKNGTTSKANLQAIIDGSIQGILVQRETKPLFVNKAYAYILGYESPEEILSMDSVVSLIAPHERERLLSYHEARKKGLPAPSYYTYEALRKDGSIIILRQAVTIIKWAGQLAVLSTMFDITERRKEDNVHKARLRIIEFAEKNSLDDLLQYAIDEICAITNSQIGFLHYVDSDQKTLSLQAWSTNTLENMCTAEGKGHHYHIEQAGVWVDCVRTGAPVLHNDYASLPHRKGLPEGHAQIAREMLIPIIREEKIVAIIGVGNKEKGYQEHDVSYALQLADLIWDVAERKRAEYALQQANQELTARLAEIESLQAILREQAIRDSLTGLFNRRYLHETLEREFSRAVRNKYMVSVMLMDIDHFKHINDTYGHAAGDEILRALSVTISLNIRKEDIPCRYGGEEFVIVMPDAPLHSAEQRARALHKKINSIKVDFEDQKLQVTVSLGIAAFPLHGDTGEQLLMCADQALYKAKQIGRNRVIVYKDISGMSNS